MKFLFRVLPILLLTVTSANAQSRACGFDPTLNQSFTPPPSSVLRTPGDVYVIPTVVHVMHNNSDPIGVGSNISDAQVLNAIADLNNIYRNASGQSVDMEIEFCLAKIDPLGNVTNGIDRINLLNYPEPGVVGPASSSLFGTEIQFYAQYSWDALSYLNIWVAPSVYARAPNGQLYSLWGMAPIPSYDGLQGTSLDGVWMRNDEFGSIGTAYNTSNGWLAHEVGHYLNLVHLSDGACDDQDQLGDTPKYDAQGILTLSQNPNYVCGTIYTPTCTVSQPAFVPDFIMIGTAEQDFDRCYVRFTTGQRNWVDQSFALRPTVYYIKDQTASTRCGCQSISSYGTPVQLGNQFNVGYGSSSSYFFTPFDPTWFALLNIPVTGSYSVIGTDVLRINGDNLANNGVGDYNTGLFADAIDQTTSVDFSLDGQHVYVASSGTLALGDNTSVPMRSANLNLECTSLLELDANANVDLFHDSKIIVKSGGTLLIRAGANITLYDNSMIMVESGGFICVESGANINLNNHSNVISISPTATFGINPVLTVTATCNSQITFNGLGAVTCLPDNFTLTQGALINTGGTTVWNSSKSIQGSVFVTNNSTLVISGNTTVIEFAESRAVGIPTNIIVDRGSKLIIEDGATLQGNTECQSMWDGIQVWGDRNSPQLPYSSTVQGQVIMRTGAVIKDAYEGITVCKVDADGTIDWNFTGGIVLANKSRFVNCGRAVNFLSYRSGNQNNISYFNLCTFETNGRLNNPTETPRSFVSLYDVKGIRFIGCIFQNLTPTLYWVDERGSGITSVDAGFYVDDNCVSTISPCPATSVVHNRFVNLYYGIYATDATPLNAVKVNDCDFINNNRGAIFRGMDYPVITRNRFDVGMLEITNNGMFLPYGLFIEFCTGYRIDENNFNTSIVGNTQSTGLAIYYSGPQANIFYNNTFDNLEVGSLIMENNNGGLDDDGLLIKCNDYGNSAINAYDIALTENGTIEEYQGAQLNATSLAGNTFSHSCVSTSVDNDLSAPLTPNSILYTHHAGLMTTPLCYSTNTVALNQVNIAIYNKATSCPTSFTECTLPCVKNKITYNESQANVLRLEIDDNNTVGLLNIIATGSNGQVQSALLYASPYLSDEVLLAAVNRPNPLPPGILKNIIVANSPVSPDVKSALDNISLPNGIRNQINDAQTGISARTILESQISYYSTERELNLNELIRIYLTDTTIVNGPDSVVIILKGENRVEYKCKLAALYVQQGDYTNATALLDSLELAGHDDNFCKLQRYIIELRQDVAMCYKLKTDTILKEKVEEIATDHEHSEGCANAQALLSLVFDQQFPETITLPSESSARFGPGMQNEQGELTASIWSIYPNPAESSVNIQMNIPDSTTSTELVLLDIFGNEVLRKKMAHNEPTTILSLENYSAGLYVCILYRDGEAIETKKLIVTK